MAQDTYTPTSAMEDRNMEKHTCTWCEEEEAVVVGYDEHNGPWSLCATCKADAEAEGQVL